jgi:uncharacterized protein (TIGR02453 family)
MTLLSRDTIDFLTALRIHNDRQWFDTRRADYEAHLKLAGARFADAVNTRLADATGEAHEFRIFRIHRDIRFSNDKTPYNAHLRMSFSPGGSCRSGGPTWMIGLDPDGLTIGAGIFSFSGPQQESWRESVAGAGGETIAALLYRLENSGVRIGEPELKRVPAPYPSDHVRAGLLRHKGMTAWIDVPDTAVALGADGPANCVAELLRLRELTLVLRSL